MNKYHIKLTLSNGTIITTKYDGAVSADNREDAVNQFTNDVLQRYPKTFNKVYIQHVKVERVKTYDEIRLDQLEEKVNDLECSTFKTNMYILLLYALLGFTLLVVLL